jgi:hypothetical protein
MAHLATQLHGMPRDPQLDGKPIRQAKMEKKYKNLRTFFTDAFTFDFWLFTTGTIWCRADFVV